MEDRKSLVLPEVKNARDAMFGVDLSMGEFECQIKKIEWVSVQLERNGDDIGLAYILDDMMDAYELLKKRIKFLFQEAARLEVGEGETSETTTEEGGAA